ncbi:putative nitronate monooxygenase [Lachnellula willkommii]|uniref:Putative nitronate monooxygenase n=1 Tax=Lachnellula willkommii TaxID=215461 RepID=A0A559M6Z7_9HELO|nr:putative nitronate monooxygenase [Lachnellula willkommii]
MLNIKHPVMLAGMGVAAGPRLAAAVTNAGGIGVIGGHGYTPKDLQETLSELKSRLVDKNAAFGVDLLLPKVGGSARKTNIDYTKGKLDALIDVVIESGAKLFVSAIGIPPRAVVDRLHKHGVLYMNMIGHPKHVAKCINNGVDILCAQAGEGGGHTGDIPLSVLIPAVARLVKGKKSPLTNLDIAVVAAGGISSGETLAASLMLGASAVWIGTRFILADEAGASKAHQEAVKNASWDDNIRTVIFSGRPMRVLKTPYISKWEEERQQEIRDLTRKGIRPVQHDLDTKEGDEFEEALDSAHPFLMGKVAAVVDEKKSAKAIVDEIVEGAAGRLLQGLQMTARL